LCCFTLLEKFQCIESSDVAHLVWFGDSVNRISERCVLWVQVKHCSQCSYRDSDGSKNCNGLGSVRWNISMTVISNNKCRNLPKHSNRLQATCFTKPNVYLHRGGTVTFGSVTILYRSPSKRPYLLSPSIALMNPGYPTFEGSRIMLLHSKASDFA
jgi:hypothetical protein